MPQTHQDDQPDGLLHLFASAQLSITAAFDEDDDEDEDDREDVCPTCHDENGDHHGPRDCPHGGCEPGEHCPWECPYETGHTDWNRVYPHLPDTMHRGMAVHLPGHDPDAPHHQTAHDILNHADNQDLGMGTHWTPTEDQGRHYAAVSRIPGHHNLHVVLHAHRPDRDDIEEDPHELLKQDVIGFDLHQDAEIPLQRGAPVHIKGVSWKTPGTREWTRHDFGQPVQHRAHRHQGMPSERHPRPEGFTSHIQRYTPNRGPGSWHGASDWHTEQIRGLHNGQLAASIAYHVHPAGHALYIDKMDSHQEGRGHASALMDDLLSAYPKALVNMGHYTPHGAAWRSQYRFPAPDRDVHHIADKPHLWDQYFNADDVSNDMERNRQTNRHHGRPDPYLPPVDPADEDEFAAGGLQCDPPCPRCHQIEDKLRNPEADDDDEPIRPGPPAAAPPDPTRNGLYADHRIRLNPEDHAFVHDRRNPVPERAHRLLQAIGPAMPTRWHPSAPEAVKHQENQPVQEHASAPAPTTRVRLHTTPTEGHPTHLADIDWWGPNAIRDGGFHRYPDGDRPSLPGPETRQHTAGGKPWLPHDRYFGPGHDDLDPRLFDGDHLKPTWRRALLGLVNRAFADYTYRDPASWQHWARAYLAGSQASHWYGNNDLDVLIGIDYGAFRRAQPRYRAMSDRQIDEMLNARAHEVCDPARWFTIGGEHLGPFDSTLYVNPDSYDIRRIKPYAAYDLNEDRWAVEPVKIADDFGPDKLPGADFLYARSLASQVRALKKLPSGQAQALGGALYDKLHGERHDAFSGQGGGLYDVRNVAWKYLAQHPEKPMEQLLAWKRAEPGLEHLGGMKGPGSDADFDDDSAMIAIVPPRDLAERLVVDDGEPVEQMHITLAYIPHVPAGQLGRLTGTVAEWASRRRPVTARVQGAGTFIASPHVLWAAVDIPGSSHLHSSLVDALCAAGFEPSGTHGFTAHLTLAYGKHHWRFLPKITPESFIAHSVYVCQGQNWRPVPFSGATAGKV